MTDQITNLRNVIRFANNLRGKPHWCGDPGASLGNLWFGLGHELFLGKLMHRLDDSGEPAMRMAGPCVDAMLSVAARAGGIALLDYAKAKINGSAEGTLTGLSLYNRLMYGFECVVTGKAKFHVLTYGDLAGDSLHNLTRERVYGGKPAVAVSISSADNGVTTVCLAYRSGDAPSKTSQLGEIGLRMSSTIPGLIRTDLPAMTLCVSTADITPDGSLDHMQGSMIPADDFGADAQEYVERRLSKAEWLGGVPTTKGLRCMFNAMSQIPE